MSESPLPKLRADVGVIFSTAEEKNGLFDLLPRGEITVGNGLKYSTSEYKNLTFAAVEAGKEKDNVFKACDALYEIFHPARIISAGFAHSLSEDFVKGNIIIPDSITSKENDRGINFRSRVLTGPVKESIKTEDFLQIFRGFSFENLNKYPQLGTMISESIIPSDSEKKINLRKASGASCCDQIGYWVADYFIQRGIPFLPVRIIVSNLADELKSESKNNNSDVSGAKLFGMMVGTLIKKPKSILDFIENKPERIAAADKLGKFILAVLEEND